MGRQTEEVPGRPEERPGRDRGVGQGADGFGALRGRDATPVPEKVARHHEVRAVVETLHAQGREHELLAPLWREGDAHEPGRGAHHEVDGVRGRVLRGEAQVALPLPIRVVLDDDEALRAEGGHGLFNWVAEVYFTREVPAGLDGEPRFTCLRGPVVVDGLQGAEPVWAGGFLLHGLSFILAISASTRALIPSSSTTAPSRAVW